MAKTTNETSIYNKLGQINTAISTAFNKFKAKNVTQDTEITNLKTAVNTMTGGFNYRGACNFKMADPNKGGYRNPDWTHFYFTSTSNDNVTIKSDNYLSDFVKAMDPDKELEKGDAVINEFDNREWWYNGTTWVNLGTSAVGIATNDNLGVIKSSPGTMSTSSPFANIGYIGVDITGKAYVVGWDTTRDWHDAAIAKCNTDLVATNTIVASHTSSLSDHEAALGDVATALDTIITTLNSVAAV